MSEVQHIPLNRLSIGADNVRRTERKSEIETLAASIAAHGLLQNLTVTALEQEHFAVVAGGRRLSALQLLAKQGAIAKDLPIPCQLVSRESAAEISLAENIQRVAMNVMDEVEAFAALVDAGTSIDDVARRFGVSTRHVDQRLALARLSPTIRKAYRKGDITLDVARAFVINDDHAAQERVFRQFAKPLTHAPSVRNALTAGRIPAHDRLARFVGADAYEAAGGHLVKDLFEPEIVFFDDGEVLQRLASERLKEKRNELAAEGWAWVETLTGHGHVDGCANERLHATTRKLKPAEKRKIAELETKIADLDTKLQDAEDDNPLWAERDAADAALDALNEATHVFDAKLMAHAGAGVAIDRDGRLVVTRGLIKRADLKTITKLRKVSEKGDDDGPAQPDEVNASNERDASHLSKTLVDRLTMARTRGIRASLAQNPHVALSLLVYVLLRRSAGGTSAPGVRIVSEPLGFDDDDTLGHARVGLLANIPEGEDQDALFVACLDQPADKLMAAIAILVAETIDLSHEGASQEDKRLQRMGDSLATALDLDMSQYWEADAEFWQAAPKAFAIETLANAPLIAALGDAARQRKMATFAKMKKAELARAAAASLKDTRWLPDVLITPTREGALAVTDAGARAIGADARAA